MDIELSEVEARIIGSLMEKSVATPDQYPLSLNALTNACNQKASRDPVMSLDQGTVQHSVNRLKERHLVSGDDDHGRRVEKYRQRLCNTEFGKLRFSEAEFAIVCLLLLRGPQTPGELRSRSRRLHEFGDVSETVETLTALMEREDGPFVAKLPRGPGRRESQFTHLFGGAVAPAAEPERMTGEQERIATDRPAQPTAASSRTDSVTENERISRLETRVNELEAELRELKRELGA